MFGPNYIAQYNRNLPPRKAELEDSYVKYGSEDNTFEKNAADLEMRIKAAREEGKVPMANEHWMLCTKMEFVHGFTRGQRKDFGDLGAGGNPTWIPDNLFQELRPVILIRHPCLAINSNYRDSLKFTQMRTGDEDFDMMSGNAGLRAFFDFFKSQGRDPIVVDPEDLLWRIDDLQKNLGKALNLDPNGLSDTWEPLSENELSKLYPLVAALTRNILESSGIERPEMKPEEPTLEKSMVRWRELYGEEVAEKLGSLVEQNLPHYEYLSRFKV